ncbi:MAG: CRISPR-associated endoribonuclease Cas6 [Kovacikia sp.]
MPRSTPKQKSPIPKSSWDTDTELVGLTFNLQPHQVIVVPPHYTTELHSWFLDQVRRTNFELSTRLHDGQSEKPFTISPIEGVVESQGHFLRFSSDRTYHWTITGLSRSVVDWLSQWLQSPPTDIHLRSGSLRIEAWEFAHPPTTYDGLLQIPGSSPPTITLSFLTPTSFRRKGNHLPLPLPTNVFQSYLRRWNHFSREEVDQDMFLDWIDDYTVILRHQIRSTKTTAGKSGSVTGFTGSVQFGLSSQASQDPELVELWLALGQLAPYCGTGHKTTFGLGQTRIGWVEESSIETSFLQNLLAQRIAELTELFVSQRQRTGGKRAATIAATWATILARREMGESLQTIAQDLEMPYETVKTYAKLARQALK